MSDSTPPVSQPTAALAAAETEAQTAVQNAHVEVVAAFAAWRPTFLASVQAAIEDQSRRTAAAQADHTLAIGPEGATALRARIRAFGDAVSAEFDAELTVERASAPPPDGSRVRGVLDGPQGAHRQLLTRVEEGLERLFEDAGYTWNGWQVEGKSRAWNGPELDEGEQALFRAFDRRVSAAADARDRLAAAGRRLKAAQALDVWDS